MTKAKPTLRLRVFAGPNGSGKSTVIKKVKEFGIGNKKIDFGVYVNADDIARLLREGNFNFSDYRISIDKNEFCKIALASGLINQDFSEKEFVSSFEIRSNKLLLKKKNADERLAQIIADFLRKKLLMEKRKFSFETVFSHASKLEIMREAKAAGYKVYLYFVSTSSADINKDRVETRAIRGGHDVPPDKIESRYFRSLDLMFNAAQLAYQAFFFDNSNEKPELFAHFKMEKGKKKWDKIDADKVPNWFVEYYSAKVKK